VGVSANLQQKLMAYEELINNYAVLVEDSNREFLLHSTYPIYYNIKCNSSAYIKKQLGIHLLLKTLTQTVFAPPPGLAPIAIGAGTLNTCITIFLASPNSG
jgi:hypothetical protein